MRNSKPSRIALALGVTLAGLLYVAGCADRPPQVAAAPPDSPLRDGAPAGSPECKVDADCVVPVAEAPDCKEVACTAECRPGTLDCGGRCVCTADAQCTAKLKDEPSP
jgi:hypothetical protein